MVAPIILMRPNFCVSSQKKSGPNWPEQQFRIAEKNEKNWQTWKQNIKQLQHYQKKKSKKKENKKKK